MLIFVKHSYVCLLVIKGCFSTPIAELTSCNRGSIASQNLKYLLSAPFREKLCNFWFRVAGTI